MDRADRRDGPAERDARPTTAEPYTVCGSYRCRQHMSRDAAVGAPMATTTVAQPPTANVQGRAAPSLSLANPLAAAAAATAPMTDGAAALTRRDGRKEGRIALS